MRPRINCKYCDTQGCCTHDENLFEGNFWERLLKMKYLCTEWTTEDTCDKAVKYIKPRVNPTKVKPTKVKSDKKDNGK